MSGMHIVRQPIFLRNMNVYAYQLIYEQVQPASKNPEADEDLEKMRILRGGFLGVGIGALASGKPAFVSFSEYMLMQGIATIFPKEQLYIGLDNTIVPSEELVEACWSLKRSGYKLVLENYHPDQPRGEFEGMADILKMNFKGLSIEQQTAVLKSFSTNRPVQFLADNIQNTGDFDTASKMGYSYFQGYFFTRPISLNVTTVPVSRQNVLMLLKELVSFEPDDEKIRTYIEMDAGLSYEVLRLVNSAYFYRRKKISSIRQALTYLGIQGIKKWVIMSALRGQGESNSEVVELSMIRSRFMEQLGCLFVWGNKTEEYSLLGLFSMLEALTSCPFTTLFEHVSVPEEVYAILVQNRQDTLMAQCYRLMLTYEKGDFAESRQIAEKLGFTFEQIESIYTASLLWLNEFHTMRS